MAFRVAPTAPARARPAALHLGIDFGTRYTKVCFRDLGRDQSEVVTFTTGNLGLPAVLLRSHLDLQADQLLAGLTDAEWSARNCPADAVDIDFIKVRLAQLDIPPAPDEWSPPPIKSCERQEHVEALAAFFLARVIDRSRHWLGLARRELLIGRAPQWSYSIGVPVRYANSPALQRFERVLATAALWADRGVPETPALNEVYATAAELAHARERPQVSVQPEISAAVRSFITSPRALEGVYLYLDIGAGTLDAASFRFHRPPESTSQITFYSGEVEQLGIAAVAGLIAPLTPWKASEVERILIDPHAKEKLGPTLGPIDQRIRQLTAKVILSGKKVDPHGWSAGLEQLSLAFHRRRRAARGATPTTPLFVGGGGSASHFYRNSILSTYDANGLANANVKRYSLETLPVPDDLSMSGLPDDHFHRFAVAYGLSIPPEEGPDVTLQPPEPHPFIAKTSGLGAMPYADTKDLV